MTSFSPRDLYGGAITVNLPTNFIDSSNLRLIPDHQEVYLSPKTLTSVIFEINQFVSSTGAACELNDDASSLTASPEAKSAEDRTSVDAVALDLNEKQASAAAALYHLHDLIDAEDTLEIVNPPQEIQMSSSSLYGFSAVLVRGKSTATEMEKRLPSALPEEYQHVSGVVQTRTTIRLLLVRLEAQRTDLCVVVNVPWKELEAQGNVDGEEVFAERIVENVVASLEVNDFGLFGGEREKGV